MVELHQLEITSMPMAARKVSLQPEATAYLEAKARWETFLADREAADQAVKGAKAAVRALAGGFRQWRAQADLEAAEERLAQIVERLGEERDAWDRARSAEAERIALTLQPRHRQAIANLARAVEAVSRAIAAEEEVRAEFASAGIPGEGASLLLPDTSGPLLLGRLDDYGSIASQWNRRMLELGVLS